VFPIASRIDSITPSMRQTTAVDTYGQFCPIARGAEVLAMRWMPLIVRNLLLGCRTFGEIREGLPGISRTLLSQCRRRCVRAAD
jgi:DNA-binding HxlR family transcriptional regulator